MQVSLINTYSTLNLGDAAIYAGLSGLLPGSQVFAHFRDPDPERIPGITLAAPLAKKDVHISVGGDIFNNARPQLITRQFLQNLWQLWQHPGRTLLFGQSIPRSCQGISFRLLCRSLQRLAAVCVRDQESQTRLQAAGVNANLSYDIAFSLTVQDPDIISAQEKLTALQLKADHLAVLSLRGFDRMYSQDQNRFFSQLVTLTQTLHRRGYQPLILLQSKAYGADHDGALTQQLMQEVPEVAVLNPFGSTLPAYRVAMGVLAISRLAIGVRYHTSVLRLATGRMPFNLYYSNKGKDLTDRLGIPGCALETFDPQASLETIESTADMRFDHDRIRSHVQQAFAHCLYQAYSP